MQNLGNVLATPEETSTPSATPVQAAPETPVVASAPMSQQSEMNSMKGSMKPNMPVFLVLCAVVIAGGVATGAGLSKLQAKGGTTSTFQGQEIKQVAEGNIQKGQIFGSPNEKDFKDSAEGYLEVGGVDGEGSHRLLREGGISQTVYLTSSVTDLDKFRGMRVKVWGETFKAQKAGWLMDVGRVEVVDTAAQPPEGAQPATKQSEDGE